jgi:hypothetical protein
MSVINASVGKKGVNKLPDVKLVQKLLNKALHADPHVHRLSEDGQCGPRTEAAIVFFQQSAVRQVLADGLIEPIGPTFKALTARAAHPYPPHVVAFILMATPSARATRIKWGVPASVLVAQAAQESAWGRIVKGNAYFGIKGKSSSGDSVKFKTHEVEAGKSIEIADTFRAYKNFSEAADGYGEFLRSNPRYGACFAYPKDPVKFIETLANAGYATDPNYAKNLKNIIRRYALTDLDL